MYVRKREPAFIPKLIQRRLRLRNCFSEEFPKITSIYVRRHQHQCMQGNSLRAASRQLRFETDLLIDEEIKSGKIDIPFVLDVMIVKEIGVFPTWISFPYKPQHLDKLTINLRIVQPGTSVVPTEWIEVARYGEQYRSWFKSPLAWNIIMVIAFYALGQFSMKPDTATSQRPWKERHLLSNRLLEVKETRNHHSSPTPKCLCHVKKQSS